MYKNISVKLPRIERQPKYENLIPLSIFLYVSGNLEKKCSKNKNAEMLKASLFDNRSSFVPLYTSAISRQKTLSPPLGPT